MEEPPRPCRTSFDGPVNFYAFKSLFVSFQCFYYFFRAFSSSTNLFINYFLNRRENDGRRRRRRGDWQTFAPKSCLFFSTFNFFAFAFKTKIKGKKFSNYYRRNFYYQKNFENKNLFLKIELKLFQTDQLKKNLKSQKSLSYNKKAVKFWAKLTDIVCL